MPSIATSRVTASDSRASVSEAFVSEATADPWQEAEPTAKAAKQSSIPPSSLTSKPGRSPLRGSPALPLILMVWFTVVVLRAALELSVELGVGIVALVRWGTRRYQAQQAVTLSANADSAPSLEPLATAG